MTRVARFRSFGNTTFSIIYGDLAVLRADFCSAAPPNTSLSAIYEGLAAPRVNFCSVARSRSSFTDVLQCVAAIGGRGVATIRFIGLKMFCNTTFDAIYGGCAVWQANFCSAAPPNTRFSAVYEGLAAPHANSCSVVRARSTFIDFLQCSAPTCGGILVQATVAVLQV